MLPVFCALTTEPRGRRVRRGAGIRFPAAFWGGGDPCPSPPLEIIAEQAVLRALRTAPDPCCGLVPDPLGVHIGASGNTPGRQDGLS